MAAGGSGVTRNLFGASASSSCGVVTSSDSQQAALAAELSLVRADMAWWLGSKPEVGVLRMGRCCHVLRPEEAQQRGGAQVNL